VARRRFSGMWRGALGLALTLAAVPMARGQSTTPPASKPPATTAPAATTTPAATPATPPTATAPSPEPLVLRPPIVPGGEGRLTLGTGSWFRSGEGGLTIGNLDLRWGIGGRFELRILLPGIALLPIREGRYLPALVLFAGICELGFNASTGSLL